MKLAHKINVIEIAMNAMRYQNKADGKKQQDAIVSHYAQVTQREAIAGNGSFYHLLIALDVVASSDVAPLPAGFQHHSPPHLCNTFYTTFTPLCQHFYTLSASPLANSITHTHSYAVAATGSCFGREVFRRSGATAHPAQLNGLLIDSCRAIGCLISSDFDVCLSSKRHRIRL